MSRRKSLVLRRAKYQVCQCLYWLSNKDIYIVYSVRDTLSDA